MKFLLHFIFVLGLFLTLSSCSNADKNSQVSNSIPEAIVGDDVDQHGCKGSAGLTWSELHQECIRPWEKGDKVTPLFQHDTTLAFYAVEKDAKVELFTPSASNEILELRSGGIPVWENANFLLELKNGTAVLSKKG